MSAYLLGLGFKADMGTPYRKLVLLKMIDACEDDGTHIFPAVSTIAKAAQCSTRTVQRIVEELLETGLIRLVREGGKGRRSTNEYALDLDALAAIAVHGWMKWSTGAVPAIDPSNEPNGEALKGGGHKNADPQDVVVKGDRVSPLEGDSGDAARVTETPARVTPATLKGDTRSHPTPPDSSITPPERERAGARDGDGQGEAEPDQDVDPEQTDDPKRFTQRVKALEIGRNGDPWPGAVGSSTDWAVRQFAGLTDGERARAEERRDAFLAECKRQKVRPPALGIYLKDRKFDDLPDAALATDAASGRPDDYAPPFGPVWSAWRIGDLLAGADAPAGELMSRRWPRVTHIHELAEKKLGFRFGARWHGLKDAMEPVPVGSDTYQAWRAEHEARGWPWLPRHDGMKAVYFPKGGPDGLDAFEAAISASRGPASNEASAKPTAEALKGGADKQSDEGKAA